jgi:hypothetical protein
MKVLPAAGPERTRLFVLLALLGVAGAGWFYMSSGPQPPVPLPTTAGRTGSTPPPVPRDTAAVKQTARQGPNPTAPEALKLAELEKVPDEPEAGRNPFRFGARPLPPPPPLPPPLPPPTPIVQPPPPPPQVPLKLVSVVDDPYGKKRAFLVEPSGAMFQAVDGDVIDGRYRLVKVDRTSAVVEFRDGSGRKTIFIGR